MISKEDQDHIKRIKKTAYLLNLPEEVIELTLYYTSEYIKKKCSENELDPEVYITEEEFKKRLPIIKIPYLGYLKPSYYKYTAIYFKQKQYRERKQESEKLKLKNEQ